MSQFDGDGNGPSIENGPNENGKDKVGKAEKKRGRGRKKKRKERKKEGMVESEL